MKFSPDYTGVDTETVRGKGGGRPQGFCRKRIGARAPGRPSSADAAGPHELLPFIPPAAARPAPAAVAHPLLLAPLSAHPRSPPPSQAIQDFLERIRKYEQVYEPIEDRRCGRGGGARRARKRGLTAAGRSRGPGPSAVSRARTPALS
jgi:hypothetical protein